MSLIVYGELAGSIRYFRRRAGLSQRSAADRAGLSIGGLRDIEQGRVTRPRASTLRKLGEVFVLSRHEFDELVRQAEVEYGGAGQLEIGILGSLRVWVDGAPVDPGSRSQQTLLGLLALKPNSPVSRQVLIDAVWDMRPRSGSADLLCARISRLRRTLQNNVSDRRGAAPILISRSGYQLAVADHHHDLLLFRRLVRHARQAAYDGNADESCRIFAEALSLWRGDPLDGLPALRGHPAVVNLIREYRSTVLEYSATALDLHLYPDVLPLLQQVADADPLHEAVHAQLMVALAGTGQQAAALGVFDTLRRRLAEELGAYPGPELVAAYQRVLNQEVSPVRRCCHECHRALPVAF